LHDLLHQHVVVGIGASIKLQSCTTAGDTGGALSLNSTGDSNRNVTVSYTSMSHNLAINNGGATHFVGLTNSVVEECAFTHNTAGWYGGSFNVFGVTHSQVNQSIFNNSSGKGSCTIFCGVI